MDKLTFFITWLSVGGFLSIPYYLRTHRPEAYRGFWKVLGEIFPMSPQRLGMYVIGSVIGFALIVAIDFATQGTLLQARNLFWAGLFTGIQLCLLVVSVIIVRRRYREMRHKDRS